ncbi:hypothetical protein [Ktedonobacter racemifer]|uniref:CYTH domain-containing protein n=1 Tax=Ktedonobacter racemifer DSM 44963 TaxID=485913 RepID=D6TBQ0_KTERA|nr:hypothetical protein [Ktedonobacter racemifer]EFH89832.1 conserved hypothetical protein [Ktedonobacter racemifer DSM 44963]
MLKSVEIRWFLCGKLEEDILKRFKSKRIKDDIDQVNLRKDVYFVLCDTESIGMKIRGCGDLEGSKDKIEIKWRQMRGETIPINGNKAYVEHWMKWGFSDEDDVSQSLSQMLLNTSKEPIKDNTKKAWVTVEKARYSRKYELVAGTKVKDVPIQVCVKNRCTAELTALKALDQEWWTLGFEAIGENFSAIENAIKYIAEHITADLGFNSLKAEDSYGYPKWLHILRSK